MAELLVRAAPHWMDEWDATKVASLSAKELIGYNSRTQIGDIIVVKPDGWPWGKEECLPTFVVVKLPGVSVDDVKHYEEVLLESKDAKNPVILKRRKYRIPETYVKNLVSLSQKEVTINTAQISAFRNTIIEKTKDA